MADPAPRVSASNVVADTSSNLTVTLSDGPDAGELIIVIVAWNESPPFSTLALSVAGFSTIASITSADWNPLYILGKIAAGTEGTTYTASWSGGAEDGGASMAVLVFPDANSSLPTNTASTNDTSASTSYSIPALTTTKNGSYDLVAVTSHGNSASTQPNFASWGTSLGELFDIAPANPNAYPILGVAGVTRATAGSQAATTVTCDVNDKNVALRIEIEPAAVAKAPPPRRRPMRIWNRRRAA